MPDFETLPVVSVTNVVRPAAPFVEANMAPWTEVSAATANAWQGFWFWHQDRIGDRGIMLIAKGDVGSEVIIGIVPSTQSAKSTYFYSYVGVPVPSGTRLSVAFASSDAGSLNYVSVVGVVSSIFDATPPWTVMESGPYNLEDDILTYGKFAPIDAGAVASTKGGYEDVVTTGLNAGNNVIQGDSLAQTYDYLGILFNDNHNTSASNNTTTLDLATGVLLSETAIIEDFTLRKNNVEISWNGLIWTPSGVSAGTRISARASTSEVEPTDRLSGCLLFGLR